MSVEDFGPGLPTEGPDAPLAVLLATTLLGHGRWRRNGDWETGLGVDLAVANALSWRFEVDVRRGGRRQSFTCRRGLIEHPLADHGSAGAAATGSRAMGPLGPLRTDSVESPRRLRVAAGPVDAPRVVMYMNYARPGVRAAIERGLRERAARRSFLTRHRYPTATSRPPASVAPGGASIACSAVHDCRCA